MSICQEVTDRIIVRLTQDAIQTLLLPLSAFCHHRRTIPCLTSQLIHQIQARSQPAGPRSPVNRTDLLAMGIDKPTGLSLAEKFLHIAAHIIHIISWPILKIMLNAECILRMSFLQQIIRSKKGILARRICKEQ